MSDETEVILLKAFLDSLLSAARPITGARLTVNTCYAFKWKCWVVLLRDGLQAPTRDQKSTSRNASKVTYIRSDRYMGKFGNSVLCTLVKVLEDGFNMLLL